MASLEGNMQAQPRVFAHDMIPLALGNINPDGGITMTSGGTGYSVGDVIILGTTSGSASQYAGIKVTSISGTGSTGPVKGFDLQISGTVNKPFGEGYAVGDTANHSAVSPAGGSGFASVVKNIDIPFTGERGACIYSGIAITNGLSVILESGELYNGGHTAKLKGITAGSFLPILAKRIVAVDIDGGSTAYGAGDLIAMY